MAWIPLNQSVFTHRKTMALAETLDIPEVYAVGHLTSLWLWCMDNAPDGSLTGVSARIIARAAQWSGSAADFLAALLDSGYLQESEDAYLIPNWIEYGGKLITQKEKDAERKRAGRSHDAQEMSAGCPPDVRRMSDVEKKRREEKREEMPSASLARTRKDDDDEIRPVPENQDSEVGETPDGQGGEPDGVHEEPLGLRAEPLGLRAPDPEPDAAFLESLSDAAPPLPAPPSRRDRQRADAQRRTEILALIQAFGEVRYRREPDAQVTAAELEKVGGFFAQLWELGVTPVQVKRVVAYAMKTWPDPKMVQPRTVVERWSGLLADSAPREASPRPASSPSPLRGGGGQKQKAPDWRPGMPLESLTGAGGIVPPRPQADGTVSSPTRVAPKSEGATLQPKDHAEGAFA